MRLLIFIFCFFTFSVLGAQFGFPPLSVKGEVSQTVGYTQVHLRYERPAARGRVVFGGLVPWNKVWRTGAGYATTIAFDRAVRVGGQSVPSGRYALLTIPRPDANWTVILNADTTLYGSRDYRRDMDVARFAVPATTGHRHYESLTITIDPTPIDATVYVNWTDVQLSFPLKTDTEERVEAFILAELVSKKSTEAADYAAAAEYYDFDGRETARALDLARYAWRLDSSATWAARVQTQLLEKMGRYLEASQVLQTLYEYRLRHPYENDPVNQQLDLAEWERSRDALWSRAGFRTETIRPGTGPLVEAKDTVLLHEKFHLAGHDRPFFSTWERGRPIRVHLGQNQIIAGLEMGITGMQVGERRRIVIPPELARRTEYPAGLTDQDTLYYEVEVLEVLSSK